MTVWEDLMNCICQNAPQRPGVTEVLDSLQQHTVYDVCRDDAGNAEAIATADIKGGQLEQSRQPAATGPAAAAARARGGLSALRTGVQGGA